MPKDVSKGLPFPGEYGPDGFATQYIKLDGLPNTELADHCRNFKLPHSGNKAALVERLTKLSGDKSRWESLIPGATNSHKGARKPAAEKKTKPKQSAVRRENLFNGTDGVRVLNKSIVERSKDLRTTEEKAAILPWAQRIVSQYPYQPIDHNASPNASIYISPPNLSPAQISPNRNLPVSNPVSEPQNQLFTVSDLMAFVQQRGPPGNSMAMPVTIVENPLPPSPLNSSLHTSPIPPVTSMSMLPSVARPSEVTASASTSMLSRTSTAQHVNSDSEAEDVPTRTLTMAGGKFVTFCERDVPDPPAVSYAKSIEDLLLVWTDISPHWNGTSPLKIKGVPIPLVYWPTVYKYWKHTQWKGVKKSWFDFKVLVAAMSRSSSLNDFWARYSAPDKSGTLQRLKYTPLLAQLARERTAENARLAELAHQELTTEQLTYRKGGKRFVMTKPAMIAAHYRRLKGLQNDLDDEDEDLE